MLPEGAMTLRSGFVLTRESYLLPLGARTHLAGCESHLLQAFRIRAYIEDLTGLHLGTSTERVLRVGAWARRSA